MELLKELCLTQAISGFEENIAQIMKRELSKTCSTVEQDSFGNVIATKGKGKTKIMLAAHMDEVGLMVKQVDDHGFLNFIKIGGIDDRSLVNQRVQISTKNGFITGIIGSKPPHLQKPEERKKVMKHDEMFIDIGAKSREEAEQMVDVGDQIIFEPNFGKLTENVYYGKAIDNRLGCYVLLNIMERLPDDLDITVYAVGTAQEEVGLKGARVSAFKLNPDYAFAIDTTIAGDTPHIKSTESNLKIGKGPAITIVEASGRGVVTHPKVRKTLIETADKNNIPYQLDVVEGGMTDGAMIYLTREGIPTGVISIACRYIHGATGVFDINDIDSVADLMIKALEEFA